MIKPGDVTCGGWRESPKRDWYLYSRNSWESDFFEDARAAHAGNLYLVLSVVPGEHSYDTVWVLVMLNDGRIGWIVESACWEPDE